MFDIIENHHKAAGEVQNYHESAESYEYSPYLLPLNFIFCISCLTDLRFFMRSRGGNE